MVIKGAPGSAAAAHGIVRPGKQPSKPSTPAPGGDSNDTAAEPAPASGGSPATTPPATPTEPAQQKQPSRPAKSAQPAVQVIGGGSGGGAVSSGAGFVLALVFWTWVALPFLKGGPTGVKNTLRAKFLNKSSDGSWLP